MDFPYKPTPGEVVLMRGVVSADGRTVTVAPGAELLAGSLDIVVGDVPPDLECRNPALLFFETPEERQTFFETLEDEGAIDHQVMIV